MSRQFFLFCAVRWKPQRWVRSTGFAPAYFFVYETPLRLRTGKVARFSNPFACARLVACGPEGLLDAARWRIVFGCKKVGTTLRLRACRDAADTVPLGISSSINLEFANTSSTAFRQALPEDGATRRPNSVSSRGGCGSPLG